jgi:hypothetical protein
MTLPIPVRLLLLVAGAALGLSACSDEDPPTWLQDLADEAQAASTTVPAPTTVPSTTSVPDEGDTTAALDLVAGTCVSEAPFTEGQPVEVVSLPTVDCETPHRAEVYDVVRLPQPASEPFPGDRLVARSRQVCLDGFEAFVGIPWTESELEFVSLRPTEASWAQGDRAVACVLFRPDGKNLEGTALDARF